MATLGLAPFYGYSTRGGAMPVEHGIEDASMSWVSGALLVNAAGQAAEAGADPANLIGVALTPASGVENSDVMYLRPRDDDEFEATLTTSAFTYALVGTERDNRYGVARDATTKYWYIDQAETTADVVVITKFISKVGDINPRVICRFLPGVINAA